MKDLFAAREAFEAGKKQKARNYLQAVEPEVEKIHDNLKSNKCSVEG